MYEFITGFFERKKGLQVTSSSIDKKAKELVKLMAQALPQGRSPEQSARFFKHENEYVLSSFRMVSPTQAYVTVVFFPLQDPTHVFPHALFLEYQQAKLQEFARTQQQRMESFGSYEKWKKHAHEDMLQRGKEFLTKIIVPYVPQEPPKTYLGKDEWEAVLYSVLTRDYVVVYSSDSMKREMFFEKISHILPERYLRYSSVTTQCLELKGNGNILGVNQVPDRKALRAAFQEEWILVNLDTKEVVGDAMKKDKFIEKLAWLLTDSEDAFVTFLQEKTRTWEAKQYQWSTDEEAEQYLLDTIKNIIEGKGKTTSSLFFDF